MDEGGDIGSLYVVFYYGRIIQISKVFCSFKKKVLIVYDYY